jgi:hypothetical protein
MEKRTQKKRKTKEFKNNKSVTKEFEKIDFTREIAGRSF